MKKSHASTLFSLLSVFLLLLAITLPVGAVEIADALQVNQTTQTENAERSYTNLPQSGQESIDTGEPVSVEKTASAAEGGTQEKMINAQNSNAPFFTGAIIAVLAFIGVAVFCKIKGNK